MALSGRCYDDFTTVARLHHVLMGLPVRLWRSYGVPTAFMEFLIRLTWLRSLHYAPMATMLFMCDLL